MSKFPQSRVRAPAVMRIAWSARGVVGLVIAAAALLVIGVGLIKPDRLAAVIPVALFGSIAVAYALYRAPVLLETWSGRCALALACYLPLIDSLPARLLRLWLDVEHQGWTVIFLPESLLAIGLAVFSLREGPLTLRRHWVALSCLGLLVIGGALSLLPSPDPSATFSTLWLGIVAPGFCYVGISAGHFSVTTRRTLVVALLCSTLALLVLGVIGYLVEFGPPLQAGALVLNKSHLNALGAYEELTLGNAIHMVSFLMLVLPVALLIATVDGDADGIEQSIALGCVALAVLNLLAVLVRGAVFLTLVLAVALAVYALRRRARKIWIPTTVVVVLVAGVMWSGSSGYFTALIPHVEAAPRMHAARHPSASKHLPQSTVHARAKLHAYSSASGQHEAAVEIADPSANLRIAAVKRGWEIFSRHPWLGVGLGVYQFVDPVYTAPHNFVIQQAAECGVVGLAGALFMALLVLAHLPDPRVPDLKLCLWSGLTVYIVYIFPLGGNLALMNIGLWGTTFWLFAALLISGHNVTADER